MKMDEEDGAGKKADPRVRGFLSDRDTRTVDRRGGCLRIEAAPVFACMCVRINASGREERVDVGRAMAERSESGAFEVA